MNSWAQRERARQTLAKEVGYSVKSHGDRLRVALAFPNTYWVGMSNLGFQTVYRLLNAEHDVVCERFFLPPKQELAELIATRAPLVTLESQTPVGDFDVVAFSVSFEWDYANVLTLLRLAGIPRPRVFGLVIDNPFKYVVLSLALAALTYAVCRRLTGSAFGRTLRAVREDEIAAQALGKNVVLVKIVITTISSALGALGGSLYAHYITYINPSSFTLEESIFIASLVILGGTERLAGPVVGAFILLAVPEALKFLAIPDTVAAPMRQILYGTLLILFMFVRPEGILGRARAKSA